MKKLYDTIFALSTRIAGYGGAVVLFSILWSGLITEANLLYLSPILTHFFDFSPDFFLILKITFILPFPTAFLLYGCLTRIGIPAILPSFRTVNKNIIAGKSAVSIRAGLSAGEYRILLRAINRLPVIFFIVAVIEVAYIDVVVLAYALYMDYSGASIALIFFSWFAQTTLYAGVGYLLAESVTGGMRRECKMMLRSLSADHEPPTRGSFKYKVGIIAALVASILIYSILMTYINRESFARVLIYLITFCSILSFLAFLIIRGFYRALYDVGAVVENLKERGEGIIFATTLDREIVSVAAGINAASDTINDYRLNLEYKVEERTRELSEAKDEIEAAMEELEATNETLVRVNRELEDSNVRFKRDMEMAASVQAAFLPRSAPESDGYEIAVVFRPMSGVSGDFYDFYQADGRLDGVGIFDVSGHGISSGLLTLLARSVIGKHFMSHRDEKLGTTMNSINRSLINEIGQTGYYLTGILLRFRDSMVDYANGGHPHLLFRSGRTGNVGQVTPPDGESIVGPFLGVDLLDKNYRTLSFKFNPGDSLLAYTDCLSETTSPDGAHYEESRIIKSLKEAPDGGSQEILDHIMQDFYDHAQKVSDFSDDITAIVIRKK